jgi:DNA-binding winged helix-turn-helix (wHTH) protein
MLFGPFTIDLDTRQLTRGDRQIHLAPEAFDLLTALVLEQPKVLSKATLQQRLWPETFVAEANVSNLVAEVREALGDDPRAPIYIRTSHRFGYAFCGGASADSGAGAPEPPGVRCWLEWGHQRFPLPIGEHVIGRDHDAQIRLDVSMLSRRHARLVVTADATVLEDFGSKNGTFRGRERVMTPIRLADGDAIRFGALVMIFRVRPPETSTETQVLPMS